jgi:hypothetical protein
MNESALYLTLHVSSLQTVMASQNGSANTGQVYGESALDSHSTTFIQSKDVDPNSKSENSQCRCFLCPAHLPQSIQTLTL